MKEKTYILTVTARQKNGKRHIVKRSKDLELLERGVRCLNPKYIIEIYTGNWRLVKRF